MKPEVHYELYFLFSLAIIATLATVSVYFFTEANDYTRIYLVYGNMTNFISQPFDVIGCVQHYYNIGILNAIPLAITIIPAIVTGIAWWYGNLRLPIQFFLGFPILSVIIECVLVFGIVYPISRELGCII